MQKSHHTKQKGDLGVLKAQIDLFEQECTASFDQIAEGRDNQERVASAFNFAADFRRVP
jgi:hypothetical protein